ncbi:hypothetical protein HYPDE_34088 [Hyphomicrobium denitrificans 1NES1]|uniref:Uncharacterized protein n=1 Tax=Hyphomicrobium denitrificans 1NES1 TaxID=670307 RepID=N0BEF9_9HYPH|nr:hypothetical protein HYPDE_34088 [Hyphomicrobium denitrificans 1NES1]
MPAFGTIALVLATNIVDARRKQKPNDRAGVDTASTRWRIELAGQILEFLAQLVAFEDLLEAW